MRQDWKKLGFVIAGKYRTAVIKTLKEGPRTPKMISEEIDLYLSHVSKTLRELADIGLVECLTPNLRRGRLYALTDGGKKVAEYVCKESMKNMKRKST